MVCRMQERRWSRRELTVGMKRWRAGRRSNTVNQVGGHWPAEDADADDRMGIGDAACTFSNTYSTLLFKIPQVPLHVPIFRFASWHQKRVSKHGKCVFSCSTIRVPASTLAAWLWLCARTKPSRPEESEDAFGMHSWARTFALACVFFRRTYLPFIAVDGQRFVTSSQSGVCVRTWRYSHGAQQPEDTRLLLLPLLLQASLFNEQHTPAGVQHQTCITSLRFTSWKINESKNTRWKAAISMIYINQRNTREDMHNEFIKKKRNKRV